MISVRMVQQLLKACVILFGDSVQLSEEFLYYMQLGGLKSAYRRRVMAAHPDRCGVAVRSRQPFSYEAFASVQEAYRLLEEFIQWRDRQQCGFPHGDCSNSMPQSKKAGTGSFTVDDGNMPIRIRPFRLMEGTMGRVLSDRTERLYRGSMPQRSLLFGTFLYYQGLTNWRTISRVLTLQRLERPRLGEIAARQGLFAREDIERVLRVKMPGIRFGEKALSLGLLNERQVEILIARQLQLQKKFGLILLEKGLVNDRELRELLHRFRQHNLRVNR